MDFYINCSRVEDHLLLVKIENDKKKYEAVKYEPHLFFPTKRKTPYKDFFGCPVEKRSFRGMKNASFFIQKHFENFNASQIYGNTSYEYVFLSERYPKLIDYDQDLLTIVYIDIEVASENGFAIPRIASEEIQAITIRIIGPRWEGKDFLVYGRKNYETDREDLLYRKFKDERDLILQFIEDWEEIAPDIVVGWYSERYDIPYIYNRIKNLFDEKTANRLSPWDLVIEKKAISPGKPGDMYYDIIGVSSLDYMCLYQKFAPRGKSQERNTLDNICHVELDERKLSYEEYGSLHKLYKKNHQKFMDYNIHDVELVQKLDRKLQLLSMSLYLAYDAKVNFYDVFSQVRMWDAIIYNHLKGKMMVVPLKKRKSSEDSGIKEEYPGAYVKQPDPSLHEWVSSFDLDSMYPMLMVQLNISPETLTDVRHPDFPPEKLYEEALRDIPKTYLEKLLSREMDTEYLKEKNLTLSGSGYHFSKKERGIIPEILINMYKHRQEAKSMKQKYKDMLSIVEDELKDRNISV